MISRGEGLKIGVATGHSPFEVLVVAAMILEEIPACAYFSLSPHPAPWADVTCWCQPRRDVNYFLCLCPLIVAIVFLFFFTFPADLSASRFLLPIISSYRPFSGRSDIAFLTVNAYLAAISPSPF